MVVFSQEGDWCIPWMDADRDSRTGLLTETTSQFRVATLLLEAWLFLLLTDKFFLPLAGPLKQELGTIIPNCILRDVFLPNLGVWSWWEGK